MKLASWKHLRLGLSGCATVLGMLLSSYASTSLADPITGTWGLESFSASGNTASLTLDATVTSGFISASRVEVWAFNAPYGGSRQNGTMLLRWDPTSGGGKTPSLALPTLADGSYHLAVLAYVRTDSYYQDTDPTCRIKNSNLNDWTSGNTEYCSYGMQIFDNLVGSLNCTSGSCTTLASMPVAKVVPQTGQWWNSTENGRGFFIQTSNGTLAALIQAYDANGTATWYLTSGPMSADGSYSGQLQQYSGGQTLTGAYVAPAVVNSNAGTISFKFSDSQNGVLTLPDGRQIPIKYFNF